MNNNAQEYRILVINPGSTSTKISVCENEEELFTEVIRHQPSELQAAGGTGAQKHMRVEYIQKALENRGIAVQSISAAVGRGGLLRAVDSGTYLVNDRMLEDLAAPKAKAHASMLGGIIAAEFAAQAGVPAYVTDPVVVDEMEPAARLTGFPGIGRRSVFHALNQKAVARRCAGDMGVKYEDCRFIVAHMGGGISVGAHRYGRVIDVNDAIAGDGPFSPERCGSVSVSAVVDACFSGKYTEADLKKIPAGTGGMYAYLGITDMRECERLLREGDEKAALVFEAMAYNVSKAIGAMGAALEGRADAVILTGGLAYSARFTGCIKHRVDFIAPVKTYPGENEMLALAQGALRVLRGEEKAMIY